MELCFKANLLFQISLTYATLGLFFLSFFLSLPNTQQEKVHKFETGADSFYTSVKSFKTHGRLERECVSFSQTGESL